MNIPNILTLIRLGLVPCFAVIYMSSLAHAGLAAGCIFVLAAVTDVIDGYIARKYDQITKLGRILDPLADKLLQLTAISCMALKGIMPMVLFFILISKEMLMFLGGLRMAGRFEDVMPSNWFGKAVAFAVNFSIAFVIIFGKYIESAIPAVFTVITALAVAALLNYFVLYLRVMFRKRAVVIDKKENR